jgi:hypothetical protein
MTRATDADKKTPEVLGSSGATYIGTPSAGLFLVGCTPAEPTPLRPAGSLSLIAPGESRKSPARLTGANRKEAANDLSQAGPVRSVRRLTEATKGRAFFACWGDAPTRASSGEPMVSSSALGPISTKSGWFLFTDAAQSEFGNPLRNTGTQTKRFLNVTVSVWTSMQRAGNGLPQVVGRDIALGEEPLRALTKDLRPDLVVRLA